ncbi:Oligopeptide transport system permease protein AppC [Hyphomicrobiales bacterium]|nr:Oligopeptide transport system permease protein AppC [Hyphomicrobiales bacterium]CAH1689086.1 Di/tripeptide transport system permease protein DppC [Hyphomicrobiales bacterium]
MPELADSLPVKIEAAPARRRSRLFRRIRPAAILSALFLAVVAFCALTAPLIAPYDPLRADIMANLMPPSLTGEDGMPPHVFGTDVLGRDILSGVIYGARVSLIVAISSVFGAGVVGTLIGLIAGYARGWTDEVIMRLVDVQLAFPFILLAIMIMYILGPGLWNVVIVLIIAKWPIYARVARAEAMRHAESEFVLAARCIGAGRFRILLRHILPNALTPLIVVAAFAVPQMIIYEAALSFLGLGLPPDQISWGSMLSAGRSVLDQAWWGATFPGLAIMFTVLSINILGETLREWAGPDLSRD